MNNNYEQDWGVAENAPAISANASTYESDWGLKPNLLEEAKNEMKQWKLLKSPKDIGHFIQGVTQASQNLPIDILNLPIQAGNWLNNTNAPTIPRFHWAPEDQATRQGEFLPGFFGMRTGAVKSAPFVKSVGVPALKMAGTGVSYPFVKSYDILKNALGRGVPELEKTAQEALRESDLAESQLNQAKGYSAVQTGLNTEIPMQKAVSQKTSQLGQMEQPEQNTLPVPSTRESAANVENARSAHATAINEENEAANAISEHLNKGAAHDVRVAAGVDEKLSADKAKIQKDFNDVEKSLTDKKVTINNPKETKEIIGELKKYYETASPEDVESLTPVHGLFQYENKINIPASDFLKAIRSIRGHANDARRTAYTHGINQAEREAAIKRYNRLDDIADKMGTILEQHIGTEDSAILKRANTGWRERVVPLYRNRIYQNIHYKQQMPANIIQSLRGNEKGNQIIKDVIQKDPELLKNVIGQRYAAKPHELHNAGELAQEYLDKMPELQDLLMNHKEKLTNMQPAKETLEAAETQHARNLAQEKQADKIIENQKQKTDEYNKKKTKLENEINELNRHIKNLQESASRRNISLEKKVKAEKELAIAKEKMKKARRKLLYLGGALVGKKLLFPSKLIPSTSGSDEE
jgi:hypothetical protein